MISEIAPTIRRLPVYMLIDCSSSMKGDAIEAVRQGVKNLMTKLANDPHTCDIVWISVIVFDSTPRQLTPLCTVGNFKGLPLKIGGSSNLGRALLFLNHCIKNEVRKHTMEQKGDWKPLVFLMSDGKPTDDWESMTKNVTKDLNLVACGVGSEVDVDNLKQLTDLVVYMKDQTPDTFNQFIDFLGSTMTTASQRSSDRSGRITLEKKYDKIVLW